VLVQDLARVGGKTLAFRGIAEEVGQGCRQGNLILRLERAAGRKKGPDEGGKVFHVRAKNDRPLSDDRLNRVLSATGGQTFADKNNGRDRIPIAQFASRIEEQAIWQQTPVSFASSRRR